MLDVHHSLAKLSQSLDGKLYLDKGDPETILSQLVTRYDVKAVYWNRCYEPWCITRDKKIKTLLKNLQVEVMSYNGLLLWEPWETCKPDGTFYKVFTPFYRQIASKVTRNLISKPTSLNLVDIDDTRTSIAQLSLLPNENWSQSVIFNWSVGEQAAKNKLISFLNDNIHHYKKGRDYPAQSSVSRLSPHLHFGEISLCTSQNSGRTA